MPRNRRLLCAKSGKTIRLTAPVAVKAAAGDGSKLPTFSGIAYTGAVMHPPGMKVPVIVDLDGVRMPDQNRPALRQHDPEQIVGHTTAVGVTTGEKGGIAVEGVFSGEPQHVDKVVVPAKNGFQWELSIGADLERMERLPDGQTAVVNGREVTGPLNISRETILDEVSFVPLGADGNTSATVQASKRRGSMFKKMLKAARAESKLIAAKYSDEDIDKMSDDEAKAALKECMKADDKPDAEAEDGDEEEDEDEEEAPKKSESRRRGGLKANKKIRSQVQAEIDRAIQAGRDRYAAEQERQDYIRIRCGKYAVSEVVVDGKKVNLIAHAIKHGWTPDQAELCALRNERPSKEIGGGVGGVAYVTDKPEVNETVLEVAVLQAMRHQMKLDDDSFYLDQTPDGKGHVRRVSAQLQAAAQADWKHKYTDQVQQAAHTNFRGQLSLGQFFQKAFQAAGYQGYRDLDLKSESGIRDMCQEWDHGERNLKRLRAEGASTVSISNILANVMNKFALQGYLFVEQAWREVFGIRPVTDFKAVKSINLLGDVMYKPLGPTGEIDNASITDQAFANQAAPYARMMTIPWTHMVNDDLGILGTVPTKVGQGAGLKIGDVCWSLWAAMAAGTINGDDGNAFWRTGSLETQAAKKAGTAYKANKISGGGSPLSSTALTTAKAMFDNQIDPNGNPLGYDGMTPILLFGPSNWRTATELMQSAALVYGGASAALQGDKNVWQGRMKPVMSRYIESANYGNSATAWWLLFNPTALPVVELCFLNGVDTPAVLQAGPDYQFDRLGISIRGTMAFGATQQNFRGGVYAVGA